MSFLATAPDDGPPTPIPGPGPSVGEPALFGEVPLGDVVGPAGFAAPLGLMEREHIPGTVGSVTPVEGAAPDGSEEEPLVDPAALQDLAAGLDDPAVARDFARDYIKMWDSRYPSLAEALDRGDESASLDAVLSLKISSAMVGGIRLSRLARDIERAVRSGELEQARSLLPMVAEDGRKTMDILQTGQDLPGI